MGVEVQRAGTADCVQLVGFQLVSQKHMFQELHAQTKQHLDSSKSQTAHRCTWSRAPSWLPQRDAPWGWTPHLAQDTPLPMTCHTRAPRGSCPRLGHQEVFLTQVARGRLSHQPQPYSTCSSGPFFRDPLCHMLVVGSPASRLRLGLDPKDTSNAGGDGHFMYPLVTCMPAVHCCSISVAMLQQEEVSQKRLWFKRSNPWLGPF